MAQMTPPQEPQSAAEYDDRTTAAVKSVLIEIGQILGSFKGKFAIIGGAVPWLLLANEDMPHVGTLDVDVGLDAEALGDGEYATLIGALQGHGYAQREGLRRFQLVRQVPAQDGGEAIDVVVDFLMPRDAEIVKNDPPLISDFAVQRADGADLAMRFYQLVAVAGPMPDGGTNRAEIAVCSIPALLAMKGHALAGRYKQKDAYDIYYCVRNYPGGIEALAQECRPLLGHASGERGFRHIADKFDAFEGHGPTCVRRFEQADRPIPFAGHVQVEQEQPALAPHESISPASQATQSTATPPMETTMAQPIDNVLNARGALPIGNSIAHRSYSADRWMAKSNAQSQRRGSAVRGCLG